MENAVDTQFASLTPSGLGGWTMAGEGGFRIVVNTGALGGQEVHHLHIHVMGGPRPWLKG